MIASLWHDHRLTGTFCALALLALSGCAGIGAAPGSTPGVPVASSDPIAIFVGSGTPGSSGTVVLPETGQAVQVRVVRAYHAASGRECREATIGTQGARVYCRLGDGWIAARPLLTSSPVRT